MLASAATQSARVPAECHPCSSHETSGPFLLVVSAWRPGAIRLAGRFQPVAQQGEPASQGLGDFRGPGYHAGRAHAGRRFTKSTR